MIVPAPCDVVCVKINHYDQQLFEEMMLTCNMSYGYSNFPGLTGKKDTLAFYYGLHQVNSDRKMELDFYRRLSKSGVVAYIWTISSEDYEKMMAKNGGTKK